MRAFFTGVLFMTERSGAVRTCPDCGGILQPTEPERLTSAEVARADVRDPHEACQCLLCGYVEQPAAAGGCHPIDR